jgi:hypothetical protein
MKGASGLLASIYILHGWMDSVTCSFVLSRSVTSSLGLAGHCGRGRKLFLSCSRLLRCCVRACSLAFCVPAVSLIISRLDRSHSRVQYRCCWSSYIGGFWTPWVHLSCSPTSCMLASCALALDWSMIASIRLPLLLWPRGQLASYYNTYVVLGIVHVLEIDRSHAHGFSLSVCMIDRAKTANTTRSWFQKRGVILFCRLFLFLLFGSDT